MSTAVALFSADSLPPLLSSISLSPSPAESFLDEKVTKKRKKEKREASTVCNNDSDEFSPTFILVEITGRAANQSGEREREAERKRERIARQKRIRGIKGFAGTPLALPVQRTRTESGARGEREREDEQRVPRQNYCVRLTNPYRNVCNPPTPACVECVLQSSAPPPRGARCTGWL